MANLGPTLMYLLRGSDTQIRGTERFFLHLASALEQQGYRLVLCFPGSVPQSFQSCLAPGVPLESLNAGRQPGMTCVSRFLHLLRTYKPEVFVYGCGSALSSLPWIARLAGVPRVFFDHRLSTRGRQHAAKGTLAFPALLPRRVLTYPLSGLLCAPGLASEAERMLGKPAAAVRNGVEVPRPQLERGISFRQRFLLQHHPVILQVCPMVESEGVETTLRAALHLLRKHSHLRFVFVGQGPQLEEYRNLSVALGVDYAVTFTGFISGLAGSGVFEAADIYCQASLRPDAGAYASLEAMAFGLPVVASDTGELCEVVEDEKSGYLIPPGDANALARRLEQLILDPELRRRMGAAGRSLVIRHHRVEDVAANYARFLLPAILPERDRPGLFNGDREDATRLVS